MSDWEYSENDCPKCRAQMVEADCRVCFGEGFFDDEDDEWGEEVCSDCCGFGFYEWCRECGWDETSKGFLSPEYEAEWLALH